MVASLRPATHRCLFGSLTFVPQRAGNRRNDEAHSQALRRLELLLHHSGGIYFCNDHKTQLRLSTPNARIRAKQLVMLRFCCQG